MLNPIDTITTVCLAKQEVLTSKNNKSTKLYKASLVQFGTAVFFGCQ